jgi:hypothetical protein
MSEQYKLSTVWTVGSHRSPRTRLYTSLLLPVHVAIHPFYLKQPARMHVFSLSAILLMLAVFAAASPIMDQDKRDSSAAVVSSPLF